MCRTRSPLPPAVMLTHCPSTVSPLPRANHVLPFVATSYHGVCASVPVGHRTHTRCGLQALAVMMVRTEL
jgi:hypothetical protein